MALKLDGIVETVLPLGILAGVGYFAIVYGPGLMDSLNTIIQTSLTGGLQTTSAATAPMDCTTITDPTQYQQCILAQQASTSGSSATACAGITNPTQLQLCQYMQSMGGGAQNPFTGAGGIGSLNQGITNPWGSAIQNTGGLTNQRFPGALPGTIPGTTPGYPQYTGATQFMAPPVGTVNCAGGVCRSYVGETLNGW